MSLSIEQFNEFFHALWGVDPFSWQTRLAEQVFKQALMCGSNRQVNELVNMLDLLSLPQIVQGALAIFFTNRRR